jgi:hypothetical protein
MLTVYDNIEPSKETIPDKSKHFMKTDRPLSITSVLTFFIEWNNTSHPPLMANERPDCQPDAPFLVIRHAAESGAPNRSFFR